MTYATNGWAALADPTRRTIFERLIEHPSAVGELARELPVSRPAVSQHLRVLKEAGLVTNGTAPGGSTASRRQAWPSSATTSTASGRTRSRASNARSSGTKGGRSEHDRDDRGCPQVCARRRGSRDGVPRLHRADRELVAPPYPWRLR